jgi:hypothetical protein
MLLYFICYFYSISASFYFHFFNLSSFLTISLIIFIFVSFPFFIESLLPLLLTSSLNYIFAASAIHRNKQDQNILKLQNFGN